MPKFDVIALDADDTLWHNENIYTKTQEKFKQLLGRYHTKEWIDKRLYQTELRNLDFYGLYVRALPLKLVLHRWHLFEELRMEYCLPQSL